MERLMQRCLEYDPAERPTAKEVVEALRRAPAARGSHTLDLLSQGPNAATWQTYPCHMCVRSGGFMTGHAQDGSQTMCNCSMRPPIC